jgi:cytochrome bd-type quinol oxidase subunit 2
MLDPARLHPNLLWTTLLVCMVALLWSAWVAWRQPVTLPEGLRSLCWIAELLLIAEVITGGVLWWQGVRPARPEVHVIYAIAATAVLPFALQRIRTKPTRESAITLAILLFLLIALLLRSIDTGR